MKQTSKSFEVELDRQEIEAVLTEWAMARDSGDWGALQNCFQPDATINISWFSGPATEFVEQSMVMLSKLRAGEHSKHQIGRARIEISQNRATSESHVELLRRVVGPPFDFDTITWGRFVDCFEKRKDGVWRIFQRNMVYEKDRMDPLNFAEVPNGFFKSLDLNRYPAACRILCYRLSLSGNKPMTNIIQVGTIQESTLKNEVAEWLEGNKIK